MPVRLKIQVKIAKYKEENHADEKTAARSTITVRPGGTGLLTD